MTTRTILVLSLLCAVAVGALAADVTGKWTAQVPGREGQTREVTFTLKADGEKLTGTMSGRQGAEIPIAEGKVSGDTLSFTVTQEMGGNTVKQIYTGKIAGDEIQFKREGGRGAAREFTAKRAK
ncbi:MAG: hypothetical protein AAB225_15720 [Acidobacteriota bacterium]